MGSDGDVVMWAICDLGFDVGKWKGERFTELSSCMAYASMFISMVGLARCSGYPLAVGYA